MWSWNLHERGLRELISAYLRSVLQCSSSRQTVCRLVGRDGGYRNWLGSDDGDEFN